MGKFINDDDESDVLLDEDEVREVLAIACKQKRLEISKRETSSRVWKTVEIDGDLCNEEIPRGSGRAEAENNVQSMWACGTLGERMSAKNHCKVTKEVGKEVKSGRKMQWLLSCIARGCCVLRPGS